MTVAGEGEEDSGRARFPQQSLSDEKATCTARRRGANGGDDTLCKTRSGEATPLETGTASIPANGRQPYVRCCSSALPQSPQSTTNGRASQDLSRVPLSQPDLRCRCDSLGEAATLPFLHLTGKARSQFRALTCGRRSFDSPATSPNVLPDAAGLHNIGSPEVFSAAVVDLLPLRIAHAVAKNFPCCRECDRGGRLGTSDCSAGARAPRDGFRGQALATRWWLLQ